MPIASYNHYFGGKTGAAQETLAAMVARYGKAKGTRIFYATVNKRKSLAQRVRERRGM